MLFEKFEVLILFVRLNILYIKFIYLCGFSVKILKKKQQSGIKLLKLNEF